MARTSAHPDYELSLRLGRSCPATQPEIAWYVRRAFAAAGRSVRPEFFQVVIRGELAEVDVYVDGWISRRDGKSK